MFGYLNDTGILEFLQMVELKMEEVICHLLNLTFWIKDFYNSALISSLYAGT